MGLFVDFDDIVEDLPKKGYFTIKKDRAEAIVGFVLEVKHNIEYLIVSCDGGVSRSSAVAAAISEYLGGNSERFFNPERYLPNPIVLRELRKAFGELRPGTENGITD